MAVQDYEWVDEAPADRDYEWLDEPKKKAEPEIPPMLARPSEEYEPILPEIARRPALRPPEEEGMTIGGQYVPPEQVPAAQAILGGIKNVDFLNQNLLFPASPEFARMVEESKPRPVQPEPYQAFESFAPEGPSIQEEREQSERFRQEHPYLSGLGSLPGRMIPKSLKELEQFIKLPQPTKVEEQMRESEELGKAWRGEYGPEEQAASIGGTALQVLPLLHLPFAESPLRAGPKDLSLVESMKKGQGDFIRNQQTAAAERTRMAAEMEAQQTARMEKALAEANADQQQRIRAQQVVEPPPIEPGPRVSPETGFEFPPEPERDLTAANIVAGQRPLVAPDIEGGGRYASQEPSPEGVSRPQVRPGVDEGTPLPEQRETPVLRVGEEEPGIGTAPEPVAPAPQAEVVAPFAPYAESILKSANYVDKPEARLEADAAGLYQKKLREINLPTTPKHNPLATEFVRAHEEAHHIWSGLQNITAAEMMRADPAAFEAFKETSAGKSQLIRHKIKGENVNDPTHFDWIEAIPDLYAEMKVKGIRNPELESWLEKAIPEENRPTPAAGEVATAPGGTAERVQPGEFGKKGYTAIDEPVSEVTIPEADRPYAGGMPPRAGQKPSKIGQSIEAKAVEAKLTEGFGDTAGYDPITIKDQAQRAAAAIKESVPRARAIVRGEAPLPEGLRGTSLITAMEEHLLKNPDAQVAYELANSPLTSATSAAAQEMRLMAERVPDSLSAKFAEIKKARAAGAKLRGETSAKVAADITKEVTKQASKRPTWEAFVKEIVC